MLEEHHITILRNGPLAEALCRLPMQHIHAGQSLQRFGGYSIHLEKVFLRKRFVRRTIQHHHMRMFYVVKRVMTVRYPIRAAAEYSAFDSVRNFKKVHRRKRPMRLTFKRRVNHGSLIVGCATALIIMKLVITIMDDAAESETPTTTGLFNDTVFLLVTWRCKLLGSFKSRNYDEYL